MACTMATPNRMWFIYTQLVWMVVVVLLLWVTDTVSSERFFGLALVGYLLLLQLTQPSSVDPPWRTRLRAVAAIGVLGFGVLVGGRLLTMLRPGLLP